MRGEFGFDLEVGQVPVDFLSFQILRSVQISPSQLGRGADLCINTRRGVFHQGTEYPERIMPFGKGKTFDPACQAGDRLIVGKGGEGTERGERVFTSAAFRIRSGRNVE